MKVYKVKRFPHSRGIWHSSHEMYLEIWCWVDGLLS